MSIAVTTPTGHIGRVVAAHLLDEGEAVTLLVRDAAKVEDLVKRGATFKIGELTDAAYVTEATRGCKALFWVTPPDYAVKDLRAFQRRCGDAAAKAVRANTISRVVHISSIGAQLSKGVGPINGLHDVEQLLDEATKNVTHLRPAFFFENFASQLDNIRLKSSIFLPISGDRRIPMVATRDIAHIAAHRLMDRKWTGRSVRGVHGPEDLSFDEVAGQLSEALGRRITHVRVPEEEARKALLAAGMGKSACHAMLELHRAIEAGTLLSAEPRTEKTTTPTSFFEYARQALAPLVGRAPPGDLF
ncbi:MAG: NmrA family NAD(P)-binding protein [Planctomycetaceae bacterium]